ncbi:MAG: helix-turn-helix transcriptional regulator [Cytophagales bacterium]|nr:helix-turn-helix transcriptional regulator [Cytophagales bacterium]
MRSQITLTDNAWVLSKITHYCYLCRMGEFGKRLKALREKSGLSQADLAKHAGVEKSAIGRWETTDMMPSEANLAKLATALGLSVKDLRHPPIEALTEQKLEEIKARIRELSPYQQLLVSQLVRELWRKN